MLYADTLTMIFEGVARIIELHQPIIDSCYGPDKLLTLIELVQPECDKQSARILNAFVQRRHFGEKAQQVRMGSNEYHEVAFYPGLPSD